MARSESEETSKASFDAFLKAHDPASTATWSDGDNPPDYYLQFAGQRFAVEVSILLKQIQLGEARLRMRDIRDALADFVREVGLSAREAGVLKGKYIVYVPRAIPNLRYTRQALRGLSYSSLRLRAPALPGCSRNSTRLQDGAV